MIRFYCYHHYFPIQYSYCSNNYLLLLVSNNFVLFLKKLCNISIYFIFDYFIFFFRFKKIYNILIIFSCYFIFCYFLTDLSLYIIKKSFTFFINEFFFDNTVANNTKNFLKMKKNLVEYRKYFTK